MSLKTTPLLCLRLGPPSRTSSPNICRKRFSCLFLPSMDSIEAMILEPILRIFFGSLVQTRPLSLRFPSLRLWTTDCTSQLQERARWSSNAEAQMQDSSKRHWHFSFHLRATRLNFHLKNVRCMFTAWSWVRVPPPFSRPGRRTSVLALLSRHRMLRCMAAGLL